MKLIGIQDFSLSAAKWLDPATSISWLRVWEKLSTEHEVHALVREHTTTHTMSAPIQGVTYHFSEKDNFWNILIARLLTLDPDCIFYNCFEYQKMADVIQVYKNQRPHCLHIVRTHHQIQRCFPLSILDQVNVADIWIVSTVEDVAWFKQAQTIPLMFVVPFGVDGEYFKTDTLAKTLDFVASASNNAVKQKPLLDQVFNLLKEKGYTTRNIVGVSKEVYRDVLQSAKIYITLTLSEASGSRSLLEAIFAGAYPAVFGSCSSTTAICEKVGGLVLTGTAEEIAEQLETALLGDARVNEYSLAEFEEAKEIEDLYAIFTHLSEHDALIHRQIARGSELREILLWTSNQAETPTTSIRDYALAPPAHLSDKLIQALWGRYELDKKYVFGFSEKVLASPHKFIAELAWVLLAHKV